MIFVSVQHYGCPIRFVDSLCYGLNVSVPPKFIVEALIPSVAVIGNGTSKEAIKVKGSHISGTLIR